MTDDILARFLAQPPAAAYAIAHRILRNYEDARDAVAQAIAKAWQGRREYRADEAVLESWFCAIAQNIALMELRRRVRTEQRSPELARRQEPPPTPESRLLAEERYRLLRRAVARLPEEYRVTIKRLYWDGLTHAEAAAATGVSPACAKGRAYRARRILHQRLTKKKPSRSPIKKAQGPKAEGSMLQT